MTNFSRIHFFGVFNWDYKCEIKREKLWQWHSLSSVQLGFRQVLASWIQIVVEPAGQNLADGGKILLT